MSVICYKTMLEPWNDAAIQPPPVNTCQPLENLDVEELSRTCKEAIRMLSNQSPLHKESAILSRLLYKFDKKFRNDIGYRSLKKVNTALRRYLGLRLTRDVDMFAAALPTHTNTDTDMDTSVPARQMLQYLLVRIITFAKLMIRTCVCSKRACVFYLDRVRRGEGHWMSLMPYAVLSRIWSMTSVLLSHACGWYNRLYDSLHKLRPKGLLFLPDNYELPKDLAEWLQVDTLDECGRHNWKENKCIDMVPILDETEEVDGFDIFKYVSQINDMAEEDIETDKSTESFQTLKQIECHPVVKNMQNLDQGEAVSRETFQVLSTELKTQYLPKIFEQAKVKHSVDSVTNSDKLKEFIDSEESLRNDGSEEALSKHLSFMQWQALKGALLKLAKTLAKNHKIQKKFQKIWKEKCLDYC